MRHNGSIIIEKVQYGDAGMYTCQAENVNDKVTAKATFKVMVAPACTHVPRDQTVIIGDTTIFRRTGRGDPKPIITWLTEFPNAPARDVRAAEIYERALENVRQFAQSGC
ncbi:unnamed protein product, partial [Iphiclides podalirius]